MTQNAHTFHPSDGVQLTAYRDGLSGFQREIQKKQDNLVTYFSPYCANLQIYRFSFQTDLQILSPLLCVSFIR